MTTVDFIAELLCRVDDRIEQLPRHSQATPHETRVYESLAGLPRVRK